MSVMLRPLAAAARDILKNHVQDILNYLDEYDIPENNDEQQRICDHAVQTKIKSPHWKNEKVARKTAEYFRLKKSVNAKNN